MTAHPLDLGRGVQLRELAPRPTLPLIIGPRFPGRIDTPWLVGWVREHRASLERALIDHGAILLRGFQVDSAQAFENVALAFDPNLQNDYLGTSPRNALTKYVFTASELPPHYPIPQHCEMSFLAKPPRRLFFHAQYPNVGPGGETPLCDFRAVWRDLDPVVRDRFERLGVQHIRNYGSPKDKSRDLWKLKRWDEVFGTTDRDVVEAKSREQGLTVTWSGDRLRLTNIQPAARPHPETGELVWYNHSQVFHLSAAHGELERVSRRPGQWRSAFFAALAKSLVTVKRKTTRSLDLAMHTTFGDGSEIPDEAMDAVREAIWKNLVAYPWERGDVLLIDNYAVSHGRLPYRGDREIHVAWA